jgi:hypothetical protein
MHRLNRIDAQVLLAIYYAGQESRADYASIVGGLPQLSEPVPTHQECKAAYNKFLYIKFIVADGANTSLAPVAQQLVEAAMPLSAASENAEAWVEAIAKILATYKFKSMCDRHEWQETHYVNGLELLTETTRR